MRLLLIEDNPSDALYVQECLKGPTSDLFGILHLTSLAEAGQRVDEWKPDVVLLDLSLPDSEGIDTVRRMSTIMPSVPIVVLTGHNKPSVAISAMREGAQDFLVKSEITGSILERTIYCAIERHETTSVLRRESLHDSLTGLYNRRGLFVLAEHQQSIASRLQAHLLLLFADVDGLKHINDEWGHAAGDRALNEIAETLRHTFRQSDIIARVGGDEFVVLAIESHRDQAPSLEFRIHEELSRRNDAGGRPYNLSLSIGLYRINPNREETMGEALEKADWAMYERKRRLHD